MMTMRLFLFLRYTRPPQISRRTLTSDGRVGSRHRGTVSLPCTLRIHCARLAPVWNSAHVCNRTFRMMCTSISPGAYHETAGWCDYYTWVGYHASATYRISQDWLCMSSTAVENGKKHIHSRQRLLFRYIVWLYFLIEDTRKNIWTWFLFPNLVLLFYTHFHFPFLDK